MATETEVSLYRERFDLEELVKNTMWRELLVELVEGNKLDPWDIDISVIAEKYVQAIRKIKVLDLHVPANIIFAASVLLRMKSELMPVFEEIHDEAVPEEILPDGQIAMARPDASGIVFKFRVQPRKKITLEELMDALEGAMKFQERREEIRFEALPVHIRITREDIGKRMEGVLALIKENVDSYGMSTFAAIASKFASTEGVLIGLFVPLLFLANTNRIAMRQDEFFEEIFIKLKSENDGGGK